MYSDTDAISDRNSGQFPRAEVLSYVIVPKIKKPEKEVSATK